MDEADRAKAVGNFYEKMGATIAKEAMKGQGETHCIECEEEIPEARRKAYPSAVRCVQCEIEYGNG